MMLFIKTKNTLILQKQGRQEHVRFYTPVHNMMTIRKAESLREFRPNAILRKPRGFPSVSPERVSEFLAYNNNNNNNNDSNENNDDNEKDHLKRYLRQTDRSIHKNKTVYMA